MTKEQQTALNMSKFLWSQSLLLLEKLSVMGLDDEADLCEKLHEDVDQLYHRMVTRFDITPS